MRNKLIVLCALVIALVALDQFVKAQLSSYPMGTVVGSVLFGLIDLRVVHNTGAAWGIFAGNPVLLGVFSLLVCVLLLAYFIWARDSATFLQVVGIGLVVGGGIGNAIDRFAQGYVLDYFCTTFIDFPVFNIADVGVTCGVVLLVISLFLPLGSRDDEDQHSLEPSDTTTEGIARSDDPTFSKKDA